MLLLAVTSDQLAHADGLANADSKHCSELEAKIQRTIESGRGCSQNSDCTIESLGCPFDCSSLINKASMPVVQKMIVDYRARCPICEYDCGGVFGGPACVDGRCERVDG